MLEATIHQDGPSWIEQIEYQKKKPFKQTYMQYTHENVCWEPLLQSTN